MKTKDQISKIKAVVLYILDQYSGRIDNLKLYKLMYFAQKEHLKLYGSELVGETFKAIQHGPVPTFTKRAFDALFHNNEKTEDIDDFCISFETHKQEYQGTKSFTVISSSEKPDMDELSMSNIKCIDAVMELYKDKDAYELCEISHKDKAWIKASKRAEMDPQSNRMTTMEILWAANASKKLKDYVRENLRLEEAMH